MKYAFRKVKKGQITVKLFNDENSYFHLIIADNGNVVKSEQDFKNSSSIGITLIRLLAKQLNSEMKINIDDGVQYEFIFKEKGIGDK
jgi:two-component sensor histidine kinase